VKSAVSWALKRLNSVKKYVIIAVFAIRPGGEIGRRRGLKIPRRKACRFDSGLGHHRFMANRQQLIAK
jgi:hypothetical protein